MSVTRERFEQGMSYADYKAQMTRNRERLEENERTVALDDGDVAFFRGLAPRHALVLAEDWCGDVINNLPVLARLAEASGTLDVRVFLRDQNLDIMDQYLKDGRHRSIPVFAFFDEEFRPVGHWIERPARVSELRGVYVAELFASDPAFAGLDPATSPGDLPEAARNRYMEAMGGFRAAHRDLSDREVVRELRELLGGAPTAAAPTRIEELRRRAEAAKQRAARPVKVAITYCSVCGYEPQTLELANALMREFIYDISSIELIPWQDGTFDVTVDGELVHSMARDGGFPEHGTVIRAVRERLAV